MAHILAKGNPWQLAGYAAYFDEVHVGYLVGNEPKLLDNGPNRLVSLGSGSRLVDAILAPWHLYRYARNEGGFEVYHTPDVVSSWWTALLLRWLLGARVMLVPVAMPEQLYKDGGRSMSGLPIWLEKLMVRASFRAAHKVVTGRSFGSFVEWLGSDPRSRHKLVVVETLPDGLIAETFVSRTERTLPPRSEDGVFTLVCVSRLHHEKLLEDLIELMQRLRARGHGAGTVRLRLIGGGQLEAALRAQAEALDVGDQIEFAGAVANEAVVDHLLAADAFVSPLTGSSAREAMFCRLPLIAYNRDWIEGLLVDGEHALLVPSRDIDGLADAVERLMADRALGERLGETARKLALRLWSIEGCQESGRKIHEASMSP
jgi:glycosyltransferase involved in cell wall biosynthesis